MNIVNSLKKLYTSLGGNADTVKDVQTAPDMVDALADIAGSSIELPAVDAEDNGKVLKVVDGAWGKGSDESLPDVTASDNGKVLKVANGEWGAGEEEKELPDVTASDNGSILSVVDGAWAKGLTIKSVQVTANNSSSSAYELQIPVFTATDTPNKGIIAVIPTAETYLLIPDMEQTRIAPRYIGGGMGVKARMALLVECINKTSHLPTGDYTFNVYYIEE